MTRALHPAHERPPEDGFTLIELMVTVAVLAILMAVAVPSFGRMLASNRLSTQANEFTTSLHLARSEAVRRGQGIAIRSLGGAENFQTGWQVITDASLDGASPSTPTDADGLVLRQSDALSGKTTIQRVTRSGSAGSYTYATTTTGADRMYVVFNARGANDSGSAAFFRVCDSVTKTIGGRILQVSSVGKISLDSSTATCP